MFDLSELKTYREGNRLEAKKALGRDGQGELPRSVWETLSAFANTAGGVIVLGVTERRDDGSFVVHGIPKVGKVLDDFWSAALSEDKLSARFVKDADATVGTVGGKGIVVTRVPWVDRYTRPVYIDNSIFGGTFRRTHAGDHQCKREEVLSMLRDSDTSSQDAAIAESARVEFINRETVAAYRRRFDQRNEGHVWGKADDEIFLTDIGALRVDEKGELRPTRGRACSCSARTAGSPTSSRATSWTTARRLGPSSAGRTASPASRATGRATYTTSTSACTTNLRPLSRCP